MNEKKKIKDNKMCCTLIREGRVINRIAIKSVNKVGRIILNKMILHCNDVKLTGAVD